MYSYYLCADNCLPALASARVCVINRCCQRWLVIGFFCFKLNTVIRFELYHESTDQTLPFYTYLLLIRYLGNNNVLSNSVVNPDLRISGNSSNSIRSTSAQQLYPSAISFISLCVLIEPYDSILFYHWSVIIPRWGISPRSHWWNGTRTVTKSHMIMLLTIIKSF